MVLCGTGYAVYPLPYLPSCRYGYTCLNLIPPQLALNPVVAVRSVSHAWDNWPEKGGTDSCAMSLAILRGCYCTGNQRVPRVTCCKGLCAQQLRKNTEDGENWAFFYTSLPRSFCMDWFWPPHSDVIAMIVDWWEANIPMVLFQKWCC